MVCSPRPAKFVLRAAELVHAAAIGDGERAVEEAADLLYHTLVTLRSLGAGLDDLAGALARRERGTES